MATKRGYFVFNFCDQFGNGTPLGELATSEQATDQALIQMVAMEKWQMQKEWVVDDPDDEDDEFDEEITTLDELRDRLQEYGDEWWDGWFESMAKFPLEKLQALMDRDGWRIVSGSLMEFEGNHNDTEIHLVLER